MFDENNKSNNDYQEGSSDVTAQSARPQQKTLGGFDHVQI